jgi:hypothetical protein
MEAKNGINNAYMKLCLPPEKGPPSPPIQQCVGYFEQV